MKHYSSKPIFKRIPALRLLIPLVAGILVQFHFKIGLNFFLYVAVGSLLLFGIFFFFKPTIKYSVRWLTGISITLLIIALGGCISYIRNIENNNLWVGKFYKNNVPVLLTLQEPIVEKPKSYKALAQINALYINNNWQLTKGNALIYFRKDSSKPSLQYGSQIIVIKNLLPIINAGNPGGFNYAQYCAFQKIHFQVFLNDKEYAVLPNLNTNYFDNLILKTKLKVLKILRKNITEPNQLSIAEALLIGHRDDLDRDLVQSYSNTGVVHIIAISGLHLGMIYGLLILLFKPFRRFKSTNFLKPIFILLVLWGFCFVAGAAPSILRSAVMFSFIVVGEAMSKKTTIYNSLAASAFLLLLINPFNLWDVGFQLSYCAVLSIVAFQKKIRNLFYIKNKLIRFLWNLNAVTLSAQVLTLPIVLYHFHQFPTLFIVTNLIAVPFSGLILYMEILLILINSFITLSLILGNVIGYCINLMNKFILFADSLPFSVLPSIQISIVQACILFASIICFWIWVNSKKIKWMVIALSFLAAFFIVRCIDFINKSNQQKIIVYNVPNHTAIDLIEGRNYQFIGDTILTEDGFLRNFHIKPSRILHRVSPNNQLPHFSIQNNIISCNGKSILIIDKRLETPLRNPKIMVDVIVLTNNPTIYLKDLHNTFHCNQYVFDSSNPFWKIAYWKKDADSLHLQHHTTSTDGAFVMNL